MTDAPGRSSRASIDVDFAMPLMFPGESRCGSHCCLMLVVLPTARSLEAEDRIDGTSKRIGVGRGCPTRAMACLWRVTKSRLSAHRVCVLGSGCLFFPQKAGVWGGKNGQIRNSDEGTASKPGGAKRCFQKQSNRLSTGSVEALPGTVHANGSLIWW